MSKSHIDQLEKLLTRSKWVIHTDISTFEYVEAWEISRPNGDFKHSLKFTQGGNGLYGAAIGNEDMGDVLGCHIHCQPQIDMYFGKFSGKFQRDIKEFMAALNALPIIKLKG